jgi:hypothetical protein
MSTNVSWELPRIANEVVLVFDARFNNGINDLGIYEQNANPDVIFLPETAIVSHLV